MNKTADIEDYMLMSLGSRQMTLADLEAQLPADFRAEVDRRWIGVAVYALLHNGQVQTVGCDAGHNHDGDCVVEAVS